MFNKSFISAGIAIALSACSTTSTPTDLDKSFGGAGKDGLRTISAISDGGFIVAGWKNQQKPGHVGTGYLLKLDRHGNFVWEKDIITNGENRVSNVIEKPDKQLLIIVEEYPTETDFGQAVMMELSQEGEILRQLPFGGPGPDLVEVLRPAPDGGYLLAGESADSLEGDYQGWLAKLSPDFEFEWEHRLGEPESADVFQDAAMLPDGSVIGVGMLEEHSTDKDDPARPWAVKVGPTGNVLWSKIIEAGDLFALRGGMTTPQGQLALTGYTRDWDKKDYNSWIGMMSAEGAIIWEKSLPHPGYDQLTALEAGPTGDYIAVGTAKVADGDYGPLVVQFSEDGEEVSSYIHKKPGSQFGRAIVPLDRNIVAIGGFNVEDPPLGQQLWFLKTSINKDKS